MAFNGTGNVTIVDILAGADEIASFGNVGLFGVFMLVIIWCIVFFANSAEPSREKAVGASFVTMVAAILLGILGVVSDVHVGITVVVMIGSLVMLINRR